MVYKRMKNIIKVLIITLISTQPMGLAADDADPIPKMKWPFEGVFGKFDKQAIQRGFKVYKEVCASCHSLNLLYYRNLQEVGFSEAEVKSLAAEYNVIDGPNDDGEMFERSALPSDRFAPPYPNENAARAANNGAYPPDQTLIIKARHDGANYIYALLHGYDKTPTKDIKIMEGLYYNAYFPDRQIAMAKPLVDNQVSYDDGTEATLDQMSRDVVTFLQWAAEPEMAKRKQIGVKVLIYLIIFTAVFMAAKKRVWAKIK